MFIFNRPFQPVAAGLAVASLFVCLGRSYQPLDTTPDHPSVASKGDSDMTTIEQSSSARQARPHGGTLRCDWARTRDGRLTAAWSRDYEVDAVVYTPHPIACRSTVSFAQRCATGTESAFDESTRARDIETLPYRQAPRAVSTVNCRGCRSTTRLYLVGIARAAVILMLLLSISASVVSIIEQALSPPSADLDWSPPGSLIT